MKFIYLFICSLFVFSQSLTAQFVVNNNDNAKLAGLETNSTVNPNFFIPNNQNGSLSFLGGLSDTLKQHFVRSSGFAVYSFNYNNNTVFLTGYNPFYYFLGEKFEITGTAKVSEILFSAAAKVQIGNTRDTIFGAIFLGESQYGLPTQPLGSGWILFDNIDTNAVSPVFSSIKFNSPIDVDTKFVTLLQTRGSDEYDAILIFSNMQGDGQGEDRACVVYNNTGTLSSINLSNYFGQLNMGDGNPPNIDIMIIPIIETQGSSINEEITLNGLTLRSVSPNPASDKAIFEISTEKTGGITIDLVDMSGRTVKTVNLENNIPGATTISMNLDGVSSGLYYYLIRTGYSKLGGKINIVK